jgi:hypothetical protein
VGPARRWLSETVRSLAPGGPGDGCAGGLRSGKLSSLFFSVLLFLSIFPILLIWILIWIPICFAGFWIGNLFLKFPKYSI